MTWFSEYLPRVLPARWDITLSDPHGIMLEHRDGLKAIFSGDVELDGKRWLHMSVSHRNRLPSWDELREVKDFLIGDRLAVQVLPKREQYVSHNTNVLHVWCCLDADPVPDFAAMRGGTI